MDKPQANKKILLGVFDNEDSVLKATHKLHEVGAKIVDVYTPFPVHGLDDAMGIKRTNLARFTFMFGVVGLFAALALQLYINLLDWPMNIGGKPDNAWPAFVPVAFELTILFSGVLSVLAFFFRTKIFPGKSPAIDFAGVTDDKFAIALSMEDGFKLEQSVQIFQQNGALEITESEVAS